jgi:hypothetical protein
LLAARLLQPANEQVITWRHPAAARVVIPCLPVLALVRDAAGTVSRRS